HATLGATVRTKADNVGLERIVVNNMLADVDVDRRGLQVDDEVISFDGRRLYTVNQFKNVLGLYPRGWRVPLEYRRAVEGADDETGKREILVRLMGIQRKELGDGKGQPGPGPGPGPIIKGPPQGPSPAMKYFKAKPGFANYYFNELERDRQLAAIKKY